MRFHTRCPKAMHQWQTAEPRWQEVGGGIRRPGISMPAHCLCGYRTYVTHASCCNGAYLLLETTRLEP
jgi:hypothetical protein